MNAQPLWDWMNARHAIYRAKAAGHPAPWSNDPIFQQYRFCNVFRELDTVTIWVRKYIREPYANHPNLWFMLAIARTINWPPTLKRIMDVGLWPVGDMESEGEWEAQAVADLMAEMGDAGEKVYTGAYMIRAESDPRNPWYSKTKHEYITHCVLGNLWEKRSEFRAGTDPAYSGLRAGWTPRLANTWKWLTKFHGWGPFMAYEVVTDMRHTRYLRGAPDIMTWANAGPGALRGLNRLEGKPLNAPRTAKQATEAMHSLLCEANRQTAVSEHANFNPAAEKGVLDPSLFYWSGRHQALEMRDIEHSLCEVDKYLRVKLGEGKPRASYKPYTAPVFEAP